MSNYAIAALIVLFLGAGGGLLGWWSSGSSTGHNSPTYQQCRG